MRGNRAFGAILPIALGLGAAACGGGGGGAGPTFTGELGYAVTHYDYAFDLATRAATAHVKLTVAANGAGDCLTIPFLPTQVTGVTLNDVAVADNASLDGGKLHVCDGAAKGFAAGSEVVLAASFTVPQSTLSTSQVGYNVYKDLEGKSFSYLVSWIGGCSRHGPCDDRPDQFATYTFTVTHPSGTQVLCPGVITAGDTSTTCDFELPGGPTYSTFGLAASPSWAMTDLGTLGGLHVTLYDEPMSGIAAAVDKPALAGFYQDMITRFGPFPYGTELRYAVGPTYWWGFEHPGNIMLDDTLAQPVSGSYANPLTHVMMHEFAHQWAGDQTTIAATYDFGWKESMVEYLTFVYEDEKLAPEVATATRALWRADSVGSPYFLVPGEKPALFDFYGFVYGEGPMILFRQIEAMYGRDAVIGALKMLLGSPHAISIADVRHALEKTTGADLQPYFDAWVFGMGAPAWPTAAVTTTDLGGGMEQVGVTLKTADGKKRGCAFDVRLKGAAGETKDVPFNFGPTGDAVAPVTLSPGFVVTGFDLDPNGKCLVFPAAPMKPGERGGAKTREKTDRSGPGWRL